MDPKAHSPTYHSHGHAPVTNDDLAEALRIHAETEREHYEGLIQEVMRAFPEGVDDHRSYHQAKAKAAKAEEEFWAAAKHEVMRRGISGVLNLIGILAVLAVLGFGAKYGIAIPFLTRPGSGL